MQRRRFIRQFLSSTAAIGLLPTQGLLAEQLFTSAGHFELIRGTVGYYTERGGTIGWSLEPGASIIVDTQFQEQSNNLLNGLKERQHIEKLDLLINTHHHGDHTGGNPVFKGFFKTHLAHRNAHANQERVAKEREQASADVLLPTTLYDKDWSAAIGAERIRVHYFGPGHTNGDSVIHFEQANVAHLGDLLFNRRFPYIDPSAGGNFQAWAGVMKKIYRTFDKDTRFIFGHAAASYPVVGTRNDVKAMENYIRRLLQYVKQAKRRGQSLEQLQANTTVIPKAEEWKYGERLRKINLQVAWDEV